MTRPASFSREQFRARIVARLRHSSSARGCEWSLERSRYTQLGAPRAQPGAIPLRTVGSKAGTGGEPEPLHLRHRPKGLDTAPLQWRPNAVSSEPVPQKHAPAAGQRQCLTTGDCTLPARVERRNNRIEVGLGSNHKVPAGHAVCFWR